MANLSMRGVGIGVTDLAKSTDFYTRVLGLKLQYELKLPHMHENILGFDAASASVILMWYTDGVPRNYKDLPIKIVLDVPDVHGLAKRIKEAGYKITREPTLYKDFGNLTIGFAADPDGYEVEMIQAAAPA
jgi:lactoylglutathione lyase